MLIKELTGSKNQIEEWNKNIRRCKAEYSDFCIEEIQSISEVFTPYSELEISKDWKSIPDTINDTRGVYISGLNSHYDIERLTDYKESEIDFNSRLYWNNYGVCDNASQVIDRYNEFVKNGLIDEETEKYIVLMTPMCKCYQEEDGGWRWHKWGEYIGVQDPKHEYLYDEENIDYVFVFEFYKLELK